MVVITMDTIVHLLVEAEVVGWVLPGVSLDEAVDLEEVVEQEVHLEDHIKMKTRTMNIIKVMKMERIDPVLATAAAIIVLEQEVMVLQEPTAKVTTNPNKKILEAKRWNWMKVAMLKHQIKLQTVYLS
jgi:signal transduction protein with GAF and PtsI domain